MSQPGICPVRHQGDTFEGACRFQMSTFREGGPCFRNVLGFAQYDWQCISVSCCWNLKRWSIRELQKRWGEGVTRTKERKKAVWMSRGQRRSKAFVYLSVLAQKWRTGDRGFSSGNRHVVSLCVRNLPRPLPTPPSRGTKV